MNKLNLMAAFIAVYEEGSYTAAAKRLGKTKSLVSTQVSQLEELLQSRLITRSTRSIKPTASGASYYEQAKEILDHINDLESRLRDEQHNLVGKLRLSAPTTFGELIIMPFVATLIKKHPELQIDIMLSDRYVDIINEGFDAAIRIGHLEDSSLIANHVSDISVHLCASPEFIKNHGKPTSLDKLSLFPCVFDTNTRKSSSWEFSTNTGAIKVYPNQIIRVNSALAAACIAKHGSAIAYCPDFAIKEGVDKGDLIPLLTEEHKTQAPIHIIYPHRKHLSSRVSIFMKEFKDYLGDINKNSV